MPGQALRGFVGARGERLMGDPIRYGMFFEPEKWDGVAR